MAIEKLNKTFHSSNQQPKTSTTRKAIATKKSGGMVEWMKMKSKAKVIIKHDYILSVGWLLIRKITTVRDHPQSHLHLAYIYTWSFQRKVVWKSNPCSLTRHVAFVGQKLNAANTRILIKHHLLLQNYRVGKVLDMIVDTCRVQNNNNRLPNNDPQVDFALSSPMHLSYLTE